MYILVKTEAIYACLVNLENQRTCIPVEHKTKRMEEIQNTQYLLVLDTDLFILLTWAALKKSVFVSEAVRERTFPSPETSFSLVTSVAMFPYSVLQP